VCFPLSPVTKAWAVVHREKEKGGFKRGDRTVRRPGTNEIGGGGEKGPVSMPRIKGGAMIFDKKKKRGGWGERGFSHVAPSKGSVVREGKNASVAMPLTVKRKKWVGGGTEKEDPEIFHLFVSWRGKEMMKLPILSVWGKKRGATAALASAGFQEKKQEKKKTCKTGSSLPYSGKVRRGKADWRSPTWTRPESLNTHNGRKRGEEKKKEGRVLSYWRRKKRQP